MKKNNDKKITPRDMGLKIRILGALFGQSIPTNVEYSDNNEFPEDVRADKNTPTLEDILNKFKKK